MQRFFYSLRFLMTFQFSSLLLNPLPSEFCSPVVLMFRMPEQRHTAYSKAFGDLTKRNFGRKLFVNQTARFTQANRALVPPRHTLRCHPYARINERLFTPGRAAN